MANIAFLIAGVVGSGVASFFLTKIFVETGGPGACLEGDCGFTAVFLIFPLTWFIFFALYVMALLVWRRRPFRNRES